jgi:beta-N-acetylhexosaminidase
VVATRRRRRIAVAACAGLAAGAFAFGVALGDDPASAPAPGPASRLPASRLAGQRIVTGFPGTTVPRSLAADIREGLLAGVILFSDNLPGRAADRRLIMDLQSIRRPPALRDPLLVMVDQEGGQVKRLDGPPAVSAQEMGDRGAGFSRQQGRATAASLGGIGVNVDLAPVLDVPRPGGTIAETDRGFARTPAGVEATAVPFAAALLEGGVAATAKHFPGLGAARLNTDFAVQRIGLSLDELRRTDEAPYRRFVAAGGDLVMLSTAIYPALSPRPAAFSRRVATGELRDRLGFEGVSITDALEAASVRAFGGPAKAGLAAARAGTDLLLFTDYQAAASARRALIRGLRSRSLDRDEFELSAQRVLDLRAAREPAPR